MCVFSYGNANNKNNNDVNNITQYLGFISKTQGPSGHNWDRGKFLFAINFTAEHVYIVATYNWFNIL